ARTSGGPLPATAYASRTPSLAVQKRTCWFIGVPPLLLLFFLLECAFSPSAPPQRLQRLPYALRNRPSPGQFLYRALGFLVTAAQPQQGVDHVARPRLGPVQGGPAHGVAELPLQLEEQPLRGLLADPGNLHQPPRFLRSHGVDQFAHAHAGE